MNFRTIGASFTNGIRSLTKNDVQVLSVRPATNFKGLKLSPALETDTVEILSVDKTPPNPIEFMYEFKSNFGDFLSDYRGAWLAKKELGLFNKNKILSNTSLDYLLGELQHYKNVDKKTTTPFEKSLTELRNNLYDRNSSELLKETESKCEEILSQKDKFKNLKVRYLELHSNYMNAINKRGSNGLHPAQRINNASELVREPAMYVEKLPDKYIENSQDVREHLNKAIDNGSYLDSFESYVDTMNKGHKLAYAGKSGENLYYKKDGKTLVMNAGEWRTKTARHGRSPEFVEPIAEKYGDPIKTMFGWDLINVSRESRVKLKGIPKEYQPCDKWTSDDFIGMCEYRHIYAPPESLEMYHREMYRTAKETINRIKNNEPEDKILESLAEHFQYAANARPYNQINNSLYMNEVNTLLQRAGMKTIPHGKLDLIAQRLQPETFKKYFIENYHKTALPEFGFDSGTAGLVI